MCELFLASVLQTENESLVSRSCNRLSLTSLAYLWQRQQEPLLAEMINAGVEAILIKVAGIGLDVKHLGKTIAQMQPTLKRLVKDYDMFIDPLSDATQFILQNELYGAHICGEGGEYETLTLDCPLFKRRIVL